jgi:hypothetical protein
MMVASSAESFSTVLRSLTSRVFVPIPFDPAAIWGARSKFYVAGTVNGMDVRGVVEDFDGAAGVILGPAWRRGCGLGAGDHVEVVLETEGLQLRDLPDDVASALDTDPVAADFFVSIAPFYRNAFMSWIEATKRSPETRAQRISEVVRLLAAGRKERPEA